MNKKFTKLIAALALLAVIALPMKAWADDTYVKVTSSSQVTSGSQIIFVCEGNSQAMTSSTNYPGTAVTITSSTITLTSTSTVCVLTVGGSAGAYTFTYGTNTQLSWAKNGFSINQTDNNKNLWTIASDGSFTNNVSNTVTDASTRKQVRHNLTTGNNATNKFGCYTTSTGKEVCLYVKQTTPSYTITAESNNTNYGTVALNGSVITGSPKNGCRYASPAYSVNPENSATVVQNDNEFTVTPSANTTVTINFEAIPTHTATFSVNGATTSQDYLEGASIEFPDDPANISGRKFVGWTTTTIAEPTDEEPSFVNTDTETMGYSNVTYYAVFAIATPGAPLETKTQTLQYDTWSYSGSTTDKNSYRLFHTGSYIESDIFDLSKLSKVIVYGGTFGGSGFNSLTIGDGTNIWKNVTVSGSSESGENIYTGGAALSGINSLRVISNSGYANDGNNGTGVRISKVEIYTMELSYTYSAYCTSVDAYTINALSNNTEYGTVSLSGEVITGTLQSGCRYASPAYTVNPANSAIVVQDGNEFTVTPLANTTITINFELIPTYTLSSVASPVGAGIVVLGTSTGLVEGATTTATATANAGYKFTGWSISGTGATLSSTTDNPTTVTIGTENATITAIFEVVTTHAITYSVNGVSNTVNVEENTAVDLSAPSSALIPIGYTFKGWSTSAISTPTDTDPNDYVTSATSTADITYYAVMAVESFSPAVETLTQNEITTNLTNTTCAYGTEKTFTDGDITWTICAYTDAANRPWMQLKKASNSYIKVNAPGKITELVFTITSATNSSGGIADITMHTDYSGYIYLESSPKASPSGTLGSTNTVSSDQMTIVPTGNNSVVYMQVASGARVWDVEVSYSTTTTSNFCTSVSSVTLTEDVTIAGDLNVTSYTLTIPSGRTLAVNGTLICYNAANLIIEDGGQLITNNAANATVKKNIAAHGATTADGGWYTIASPVVGDNYSTECLTLGTSYDLFLYNEPDHYWWNAQGTTHPFTTLANGKGYLYANSENQTIAFAGEMQASNTTNVSLPLSSSTTAGNLKGFNLMGNPFTCNVTSGKLTNTSTMADLTAYLAVENGSELVTYQISENPIKPGQGFFVQAVQTIEEQEVEFTNLVFNYATRSNAEQYQPAYIRIEAGNDSFTDRAYVQIGGGNTLRKMTIYDTTPKVYVMHNGKDYAAATVAEAQGELPLNFRANENGQYTLTVSPEGVEMNYLHLIDNMTGNDIDLLQTPSYSFNAKTTDYESRFRLVFAANNESGVSAGSTTFAFYSNGNWMVNNEGEASLQVIDVMGRVLSNQTISGTAELSLNQQPGVYVLRLVNGNDVKTQKIVVR